jgi:hypothetical protein
MGKCTFGQVDEKFCECFKTFLATVKFRQSEHLRLSENTMYTYFYKFRACVKEAYEDKLFAGIPILRGRVFRKASCIANL